MMFASGLDLFADTGCGFVDLEQGQGRGQPVMEIKPARAHPSSRTRPAADMN